MKANSTNPSEFRTEETFGNVKLVRLQNGQYGVTNLNNEPIVPFGKYNWIDKFWRGFARVNTSEYGFKLWGIIDKNGKEVLPVVYDSVWKFYNKDFPSVIIETNGWKAELYFDELYSNSSMDIEDTLEDDDFCDDDNDDDYNPLDDFDWEEETWYAMTDGMYGDMPEGGCDGYEWLGY